MSAKDLRSDVAEAAATIQAELPDLLGPDAPRVHEALSVQRARLAASVDPDERRRFEDGIVELLAEREPTRRRLDQLLPSDDQERGYEGLPGDALVDVDRWVCPRGDYEWAVLDSEDAGRHPDRCPEHDLALVFEAAS